MSALLAQRAVVFVGLISYPLYLWHWPLLVYLRLGLESFALTPHRIDVLTAETVAIVERHRTAMQLAMRVSGGCAPAARFYCVPTA